MFTEILFLIEWMYVLLFFLPHCLSVRLFLSLYFVSNDSWTQYGDRWEEDQEHDRPHQPLQDVVHKPIHHPNSGKETYL